MEEKKIYILMNRDDGYEDVMRLTEREAYILNWFFDNYESYRSLNCIENPQEITEIP